MCNNKKGLPNHWAKHAYQAIIFFKMGYIGQVQAVDGTEYNLDIYVAIWYMKR